MQRNGGTRPFIVLFAFFEIQGLASVSINNDANRNNKMEKDDIDKYLAKQKHFSLIERKKETEK